MCEMLFLWTIGTEIPTKLKCQQKNQREYPSDKGRVIMWDTLVYQDSIRFYGRKQQQSLCLLLNGEVRQDTSIDHVMIPRFMWHKHLHSLRMYSSRNHLRFFCTKALVSFCIIDPFAYFRHLTFVLYAK